MHSDLVSTILTYLGPRYQMDDKGNRRYLTITIGELKVKICYCFALLEGPVEQCKLRGFLINIDSGVAAELELLGPYECFYQLRWDNGTINLPGHGLELTGKMANQVIDWLRQIEAGRPIGHIFASL